MDIQEFSGLIAGQFEDFSGMSVTAKIKFRFEGDAQMGEMLFAVKDGSLFLRRNFRGSSI